MEDKPERMQAWELAKRCFADGLAYEGLEAVKGAGPETVQVAKLQFDAYTKTAGKVSRDEWGEKQQVEVTNVSVDFRGLLEARESRLMALARVPVVVESPVDFVVSSEI